MKRGFTLIETLLAAALGSLVLLVVVGIVTVMDRTETGSVDRLARTNEMEQAQTVIRRSLGSLAMAGGSAPVQSRAQQAGREGAAPPEIPGQVTFTPTPRLILAPMGTDPLLAAQTAVGVTTTTTGTDETVSAGAGELSLKGGGAQRLHIALTSLPLPEQAFMVPGAVARSTRRALTGEVEDPEAETERETTQPEETPEETLTEETDATEGEDDGSDSELVPIFWGVFELTPPGPAPIDGLTGEPIDEDSREGWTLWWRQIEPPVNPSAAALIGAAALMDAETGQTPTATSVPTGAPGISAGVLVDPRMDPTAVPLIRGLEMCHWSVYRGRKLMPDYAATYSGELPAYVQLEIRTTSGVYANWMFEVGWATVREPGQAEAARLNQALLGQASGDGGGDGEGRRGGNVGRRGGRGEPRDGEERIQRERRTTREVPGVEIRRPPRQRQPEGEP